MRSSSDSDQAWRLWGEQDPYFAVLTDRGLRRESVTPEALSAFFASGEAHVRDVLDTIRRHLDPAFRPRRALDFGCGVGRLLFPLATMADSAIGVDVSPAMLAEARSQAERRNLTNVRLVESDDALSRVEGRFDLVHSYLVLQHIPVSRGEHLIRRLLELVAPGGVAALHVPYARDTSPLHRAFAWIRRTVPGVHGVVNRIRGARWAEPAMQMNLYDLDRVFGLFEEAGVFQVHTRLVRDGEYRGVMLYAHRTEPASGA
jgi:2-polyprenyl-3-methyl-5-hydroxy-6-metoxy-1,4-benzoquinol methylase